MSAVHLIDGEPAVKLIAGVIHNDKVPKQKMIESMERAFGELEEISPDWLFTFSDYYEKEMGSPLFRFWVSCKKLAREGDLVDMKLRALSIEKKFSCGASRCVNIDPGFIDFHKVVLASVKYGGNKLYAGCGVYLDITLLYEKEEFRPNIWTFPDLKSTLYHNFFIKVRERFRTQIKELIAAK